MFIPDTKVVPQIEIMNGFAPLRWPSIRQNGGPVWTRIASPLCIAKYVMQQFKIGLFNLMQGILRWFSRKWA